MYEYQITVEVAGGVRFVNTFADTSTEAKAEARKHVPFGVSFRAKRIVRRCESGWTGDRCTKPLGHRGPHSNE